MVESTERSETVNVYTALAKAQAEFPPSRWTARIRTSSPSTPRLAGFATR